jgi:probable HAF family extracellular repeat protein
VICVVATVTLPALLCLARNRDGCLAKAYRVVELPFSPAHLNDLGEVVGSAANNQAVFWTEREGLHVVTPPPSYASILLNGLNRGGDLAAVARGKEEQRALVYRHGKYVFLPGKQSSAFAINDRGQVAGESILSNGTSTQAAMWVNQKLAGLGSCCGGTAKAINNRGEIIGEFYDDHARYHAFVWNRRQGLRPIDSSSLFSTAVALNNLGHVVVQESSKETFLYGDQGLNRIEFPGDSPVTPRALNDCDVIVGSFGAFSDAERAFAWEKSRGFLDLNQLIPEGSGWKLERATAINNKGEIVGTGDHGADDVGFLLVPQP